MHRFTPLRTLFLSIALALSALAKLQASPITASFPLTTPKFESLQTSLTPTGGSVEVQLHVNYDVAGTWFSTSPF